MTTGVDGKVPARFISTRTDELDKAIGGGVPLPSLTLIEGQSGAGKSTLTQHLLWGAITEGERAILYTTENTAKSLLRQMGSLGMDATNHFLLDFLRIYRIYLSEDEVDAETAFENVLSHIQSHPNFSVIVLDSLSTFITQAKDEQILDFFAQCKALCDTGKAIICTAHTKLFDDRALTRVRSICDVHLRLTVEPEGTDLMKSLEVAKVRGAALATGTITSFTIEPDIGMRIIYRSKARA